MSLIQSFQDLVAQVPEFLQPLIVAGAGAVPFIEGEGAAAIGIIGGLPPVLAAGAAAFGNFVCVAVLVFITASSRDAIVARRRAKVRAREAVMAGEASTLEMRDEEPVDAGDRRSARAAKFQRAFERYGVPGVSLLGPLLLPTQFTATMLAGAGVGRARILIWQAVAILGWTTLITLILTGVIRAVA